MELVLFYTRLLLGAMHRIKASNTRLTFLVGRISCDYPDSHSFILQIEKIISEKSRNLNHWNYDP